MKRRASEPLPAAILHKKAAKVSASQNHKSSQQISVVTSQNMKENVEPVPDVDDFSNQEILDSATDEEALSLFSNMNVMITLLLIKQKLLDKSFLMKIIKSKFPLYFF